MSDPGGSWSTATLADLGCEQGGYASWVTGPGTGGTAGAAVTDLIGKLEIPGLTSTSATVAHAVIGCREAVRQSWILGTDTTLYMTAILTHPDSGYVADPDVLCASFPRLALMGDS